MITDEKGRRVLSLSQRRYISLQAQRDELVTVLRAVLRCDGIWHTDQETGETFGDLINAALAKVTP